MTDDIRALTARMADEPGSLAFLELAEALRRRGQLDAAYKVARGGLARYPGLADAHDLMARVLSDQGDLAGAFDAWSSALQLDPMRASALKGIAFLYYPRRRPAGGDGASAARARRGARRPLDRAGASRGSPARSRSAGGGGRAAGAGACGSRSRSSLPPDRRSSFDGMDGGERGLLLVDANGLRLGGRLQAPDGSDSGDRVAAQLAGVSREAARATRLLGLGTLARRSRSSRPTAIWCSRADGRHRAARRARAVAADGARGAARRARRPRRRGRGWRRSHDAPTQAALDRVTRVAGVRGALVVAASDGLVVAEQLMEGVDGQAAAALTGSLVGRLDAHGRERGHAPAGLRASPRRSAAACSRRRVRTIWCWSRWWAPTPTSASPGSR